MLADDKSQAIALYNRAYQAFQKNDLVTAHTLMQQAMKLDPENEKINHFFRLLQERVEKEIRNQLREANLEFKRGNYKKSALIYKKVLFFDPENQEAKKGIELSLQAKNTVDVYRLEKPFEIAADSFSSSAVERSTTPPGQTSVQSAMPLESMKVLMLYREGLQYLRMQKWAEAMEKFEAILAIDRNNPAALAELRKLKVTTETRVPYLKGKRFVEEGKFREALKEFMNVYRIDRNFLDVTYQIACVHEKLKEYDEALKFFREFLKKKPEDNETRVRIAMIYYQQGLMQQALREFALIRTRFPETFEARLRPYYNKAYLTVYWFFYFFMALEVVTVGLLGYQIRSFQQILQEDEHIKLYKQGLKLYKKNKFQKAMHCFQQAVLLKPNYTDALFYLSLLYTKCHLYDKAVETLRTILFINKDHYLARYNLALIYDKLQKYDRAIMELRTLVSTSVVSSLVKIDYDAVKKDRNRYTLYFEKLKELAEQKIMASRVSCATKTDH